MTTKSQPRMQAAAYFEELQDRICAALAEVDGKAAFREDAWQRQVEFLFERLAVRWTVEGVAYERQKELLARYRMASADERAAVRDALREHLAAYFPDVEASRYDFKW